MYSMIMKIHVAGLSWPVRFGNTPHSATYVSLLLPHPPALGRVGPLLAYRARHVLR